MYLPLQPSVRHVMHVVSNGALQSDWRYAHSVLADRLEKSWSSSSAASTSSTITPAMTRLYTRRQHAHGSRLVLIYSLDYVLLTYRKMRQT